MGGQTRLTNSQAVAHESWLLKARRTIFSSFIQKDINLSFLSLSPSLTLIVLTYPTILGNIKTNVLYFYEYEYPIKYSELVFVLTNFEIAILPTLTYQCLLGFSYSK